MTKSEFEQLAIRNNAGTITLPLYETIERFYMSESKYHQTHGGINETKQEFVKRVFGGKVNTPKTILKKSLPNQFVKIFIVYKVQVTQKQIMTE